MKDFRKQIASLSTEITALEDHSANLQTEAWALRQKRDELIAQMILDEKMLAGTCWEISLGDITNLNYRESSPDEMKGIKEFCRHDWHSSFELEEGVDLRFDDNEISLIFKDPKQVLAFVRKNELSITGSKVSDRLNHLKREVAALETVCHQFNLLKGGNQ